MLNEVLVLEMLDLFQILLLLDKTLFAPELLDGDLKLRSFRLQYRL